MIHLDPGHKLSREFEALYEVMRGKEFGSSADEKSTA